jgi:uptake hydrogenase large subunit
VSESTQIKVPMNRVEGDLEIRVVIENDRVKDAWSSGTMYRGIENILLNRGALDGLVITPRICGICSTAHLAAASLALDAISGASPPPDAVRIRNIALMAETVQSDMRQVFLMFAADFAQSSHRDIPLHGEAVKRYEPLKGETAVEVIRATKKVLEIVAVLGGQWPHSSYMIPGGVTTIPSLDNLMQCRYLLDRFRGWYEQRILGCDLERWLEVRSEEDLNRWLEETPSHADSDLGFFVRFARHLGLQSMGRGHENFLSFGQLDLPDGTAVRGRLEGSSRRIPAGFAVGTERSPLDQEKISEHVAHSWFQDYEGGRHPFRGETVPYASGAEKEKYSWAKAPRYDDRPAETGPLAEMVVSGSPLFLDLVGRNGASALVRELARLVRPAEMLPAMAQWLSEISPEGSFYTRSPKILEGKGYGLINAARGALGHWVEILDGKIQRYQIITPTAWNGSPRDASDLRGPWEEALIGTPVRDPENPVELGYVIRSFDPCLVCTVHSLSGPRTKRIRLP